MRHARPRSATRSVKVDRYRRALRERVDAVDWRGDLVLTARVAPATLLAASGYAFTWVHITSAAAVSRADIGLGVACVASSIGLFAGALRLSGARKPWLGGLHVATFTVLAGIWLIVYRGSQSVTPTTWMGAAGCAAIIYTMGSGHPTKHLPTNHRNTEG